MSEGFKVPQSWSFKNKHVADKFDEHVREQLPWYDLATELVSVLIKSYIPENGILYDFGCSTGNITKKCQEFLKERDVVCSSFDNSEEMAEKFEGYGDFFISDISDCDFFEFDVAVLFLSLMFTRVKDRDRIISSLKHRCLKGGCVIIMDKINPPKGYLGKTFSRLTFQNKILQGCPMDDVMKKEMSLIGVQRPCDESLFKDFKKWFQVGEFVGYIYEKK